MNFTIENIDPHLSKYAALSERKFAYTVSNKPFNVLRASHATQNLPCKYFNRVTRLFPVRLPATYLTKVNNNF